MKFLAVAILLLSVSAAAEAQAPLLQKSVSMRMALAIVEGALDQCGKDGFRVSVVVVDRNGDISASVRADGIKPHMLEFARLKAYTAVTNPRGISSLQFKNAANEPDRAYLREIGSFLSEGDCR